MSYYLIHSAKGTTWSNHKYIKKVGDKYYYKDSKGNIVEGEAPEEENTEEETEDSKDNKSKKKTADAIRKENISKLANQVMSGKLGQGDLRKSNNGKDYKDVMDAVNSKFKKPSGSGSKSSSSSDSKSTDKTKDTSEKTNKATTNQETVKTENNSSSSSTSTQSNNSVSESIKTKIKSVATISDNDSIYATQNENGTTTVTVDFADGTTQNFVLAQTFDVVSKSEKTKKTISHGDFKTMSDRFGLTGNYLIHSAKGTSWEKKEHKYSRKIIKDGKKTYYYYGEKGRGEEFLNKGDVHDATSWYYKELRKAMEESNSKKFYELLNEMYQIQGENTAAWNKIRWVPGHSYPTYEAFLRSASGEYEDVNKVYGDTKDDWIKKYQYYSQKNLDKAIKEKEEKLKEKGNNARLSFNKLNGKNGAPSNK